MATIEDYKYLFKVVLVGNAGVGKTCLVRRFTQGMFPPGHRSMSFIQKSRNQRMSRRTNWTAWNKPHKGPRNCCP